MNTFINKFGNEVKTPFDIGDILRLKDRGSCYEYYEEAFKSFGILDRRVPNKANNYAYTKSKAKLVVPIDFKETNWRLVDYRIHENDRNVIGLVRDPRGNYLVIDITDDENIPLKHYVTLNEKVTSIFKKKNKVQKDKIKLIKIIR